MMQPKDLHQKLSVALCYVLRHDTETIGVDITDQGWVDIDQLIAKICAHGKHLLDRETINAIVTSDSKGRYGITSDGCKIRCVQGHSNPKVSITRSKAVPPVVLYHGTAEKSMESILKNGLIPGNRHEVHLTANLDTAFETGRRHGVPVVLQINAKAMHADGIVFTQAENGVWLTTGVAKKYITLPAFPKTSKPAARKLKT